MSGLAQTVNIGLSGLSAATDGIQTVSNNTANVNTPGYNVQSLNQVELPGISGPIGSLGDGADVVSIRRGFDQFVYQEILQATSTSQATQVVQAGTQDLASIFPVVSGGAGGLGAAISSFFGGASTVAQNPASMPNRELFLSNARSVATLFQSVGAELSDRLTTQNGQINTAVQQINTLTRQIASLNQTITSQAGPSGSATNSLLDQRDQLIQQLSQQIGLSIVQGQNGSVDVYTASGSALVNGQASFNLVASSGGYNDGNIEVTYGPTGQDLTQGITGGQLAGLISFRSQLIGAQDAVGGLATSFASAINLQQSLGLDLNGGLGKPLLSVAGPTVYPAASNTGTGAVVASISNANAFSPADFILTKTSGGFQATNIATGQVTALGSGPSLALDGMTITVSGAVQNGDSFKIEPTATAANSLTVTTADPAAIAAAAPYVATAGTLASGGNIVNQNAGNVTASIGSPAASGSLPAGTVMVPSSYFGQPLSIKFTSGSSFQLVSSTGSVITSGAFSASSGAEIAVQYPAPAPAGEVVTVSLSGGTAVAGDSFVLSPGSSGSNGNAVALAGLRTQNLISGQTLTDSYAQLVTNLGDRGQEAQIAGQAAQGVLNRVQAIQQSVSGVNLDEEAASLVSYQQAYQASAQVIAAEQALFQSLISVV